MPPYPFRPNELAPNGNDGCFIDNDGVLWIFSDLTYLIDGTNPYPDGSFVDNDGTLWIFSDLTYLTDGVVGNSLDESSIVKVCNHRDKRKLY